MNSGLTYPTITHRGIREMTKDQQDALARSQMTNSERITSLEMRVAVLESMLKQIGNE